MRKMVHVPAEGLLLVVESDVAGRLSRYKYLYQVATIGDWSIERNWFRPAVFRILRVRALLEYRSTGAL